MADQPWRCEKCGASGSIDHARDATVYEVVEGLREDHQAASPECVWDLAFVRVTNDACDRAGGNT